MLKCPRCGTTTPDRWRCRCGHPLEYDSRPSTPSSTSPTGADLWAFAPFLPVERRVSLGAGWSPLVDAPDWNARFKLEYVSPTGSFKDRGAEVLLSRATAVDVDHVLEDSSGNAGLAIATYAARAGIPATIYVPTTVAPEKRRAIEDTGATVTPVAGSRADVSAACIDAVGAGAGWYASHIWRPAFLDGTATCALEITSQLDGAVPDAVVCPVGHGTLLLGFYRGFRWLVEAGRIETLPRLIAVQAAGTAPVVAALAGAGAAAGENDLADGVQIQHPVRFAEILTAIRASDGQAIAVDRPDTERSLSRLRRGGFAVEPTAALAPAALERLRTRGQLAPDADVIVPLTGRNR